MRMSNSVTIVNVKIKVTKKIDKNFMARTNNYITIKPSLNINPMNVYTKANLGK